MACDTAQRRAIHGNWLEMPLHDRKFTAVVGDGSFAFMQMTCYSRLFEEIGRLLTPGALFAVRIYETPNECETLPQLRADVLAENGAGLHAFKLRFTYFPDRIPSGPIGEFAEFACKVDV